jgi:adenylate cyclase
MGDARNSHAAPVSAVRADAVQEFRDAAEHMDSAVLGGPKVWSLTDLAQKSGLSIEDVQDYWRWIGIPNRDPNERMYTDADLGALHELLALSASEHFNETVTRNFVRGLGHMAERLATWQVEAMVDHIGHLRSLDDLDARLAVVDEMPHLMDTLTRQLDHAWKRQLAAVTRRLTVEVAESSDDVDKTRHLPLRRAVGFADIVGFTESTRSMSTDQLARYMQSFETRVRDAVTEAGGRVIKMVGDAVFFAADSVEVGAEVALRVAVPGEIQPVRVSMVWCRVLTRFGDMFGPGVNLASRLAELSQPDEVTVDPHTASLLEATGRYTLDELPEAEIQGMGTMKPVRLRYAPHHYAQNHY